MSLNIVYIKAFISFLCRVMKPVSVHDCLLLFFACLIQYSNTGDVNQCLCFKAFELSTAFESTIVAHWQATTSTLKMRSELAGIPGLEVAP